jgi:hypothetical protein
MASWVFLFSWKKLSIPRMHLRIQEQEGLSLNVYKLWALMGVYWFFVCIIAGEPTLYDLAFVLTFVGYYLSWFFVAVTVVVLADRRLHLKSRVKGWFKQ